MLDWITSVMEAMGYAGVGLLMFLENAFPPIPSELIMPLGGFAAARGDLTLWGVIVAGTIGSVLGQFPLYWLGRRLGEARLVRLANRHGRWLFVSGRDVERASAWFARRGPWTVLLCRMLPGVRSLISIPAGVSRMHFGAFTLYSTIGMAAWSAALAAAGWLLGENYERVESALGPATYIVFGGIVVAVVVVIARRWWRCQRDVTRCLREAEESAAARRSGAALPAGFQARQE